jgi:peptidoglycan/LPS O-acetylase OafA/YrhL
VNRIGYVPALDGLRGVAIAAVVLFHALKWPSGGFLGVDVFFVLSGFLITTLLIQEWQQNEKISLRAFYRRRALRLLPALTVMLAVFTLEGLILFGLGVIDTQMFRHWWISDLSGALYIQNIVKALGSANTIVGGVGQLWSLAAEEQFYLVWPIVLIWLLRRGSNPRTVAAVAGGTALAVLAHRVGLVLAGTPPRWVFFSPTSRSDPIMFGCLLGVCHAYGLFSPRVVRVVGSLAPFAVVAGLAMIVTQRDLSTMFPGLLILELTTGVVLVSVVYVSSRLTVRALSWSPLVGLGKISYGVYVWHGLLLGLLIPVVMVPVTLIVAICSYKYIEEPFLRKKRSPRVLIRPEVGSPGALPVLAVAQAATPASR